LPLNKAPFDGETQTFDDDTHPFNGDTHSFDDGTYPFLMMVVLPDPVRAVA